MKNLKNLTREELEEVVSEVQAILWLDQEKADIWDPDKGWNPETVEDVASVLVRASLKPEKCFDIPEEQVELLTDSWMEKGGQAWSREDYEAALAEGWAVRDIECGRQRRIVSTDLEVFADDSEAEEYVSLKAEEDDDRALRALRMTGREAS